MFSITFIRELVYGALALSLVLALATVVAVVWGTFRARRERWPWVWAAPVAACALMAWVWLYPSFLVGSVIGGDIGAAVGHALSPMADAALMAVAIGVGTYLVFTAPLAILALATSFALTKSRTASDGAHRKAARPTVFNGLWGAVIKRLALVGLMGLPAGPR
jgi:hypothetical protein